MSAAALLESSVEGIPIRRGKVRDIYDFGDRLLFVASDRISAFDWVLPTDWDKDSPPPALPEEIVAQTRAKYIEAFELLVGETFPWT